MSENESEIKQSRCAVGRKTNSRFPDGQENRTIHGAVKMQCWECLGYETHPQDCASRDCPLFAWRPRTDRSADNRSRVIVQRIERGGKQDVEKLAHPWPEAWQPVARPGVGFQKVNDGNEDEADSD